MALYLAEAINAVVKSIRKWLCKWLCHCISPYQINTNWYEIKFQIVDVNFHDIINLKTHNTHSDVYFKFRFQHYE